MDNNWISFTAPSECLSKMMWEFSEIWQYFVHIEIPAFSVKCLAVCLENFHWFRTMNRLITLHQRRHNSKHIVAVSISSADSKRYPWSGPLSFANSQTYGSIWWPNDHEWWEQCEMLHYRYAKTKNCSSTKLFSLSWSSSVDVDDRFSGSTHSCPSSKTSYHPQTLVFERASAAATSFQ